MRAVTTGRTNRFSRLARRAVARNVVIAAALSGAVGCQKSPFVADTPRTQFELHDRLHNRYVPMEEPDEFGTPQPALRARLGRPY